jgi:lysophospholipase L1-like esterase
MEGDDVKYLLPLLLVLSACSSEELGVEPDASSPDAAVFDASVPDATPPDADTRPRCEQKTTGAFIGDSIVVGAFKAYRSFMLHEGDAVINVSVAGNTVDNQYSAWLLSPARGNPDVSWIFVQCGINDVLHGETTAPNIAARMEDLLDDISANNPEATVFFSIMDPARLRFETMAQVGPPRYPLWQELNGYYLNMGGLRRVSDALNNGADYLVTEYDHGDGLHPNDAGYLVTATIIRGWVDAVFQPVPCEEN